AGPAAWPGGARLDGAPPCGRDVWAPHPAAGRPLPRPLPGHRRAARRGSGAALAREPERAPEDLGTLRARRARRRLRHRRAAGVLLLSALRRAGGFARPP